jgi:N-acetylglucosaminyl-diphospho-decaprenol L-rhamnosyltransferase
MPDRPRTAAPARRPHGTAGGEERADVAVVIVNYNSGDDVTICVRSVFESAGDALAQVVVVDNRSGDGSAERAAEAFPQIHLIRNTENRGFGAAANQGMRATRTPWVFLLNPDARIVGGTLGATLKLARGRPAAGAVGVLTCNGDGSTYPSARKVPTYREAIFHAFLSPFRPDNRWSRAYRLAGWDRRTERRVDWVSGSSVLLRREALDRVGMFDEAFFMYVEDLDLCTRMRRDGWEVWFSPELEIEHIGGTATRGQRRMTLEHSKSMYRYFVKHRSPGPLAVLRPFARAALRARAEIVSRRLGER